MCQVPSVRSSISFQWLSTNEMNGHQVIDFGRITESHGEHFLPAPIDMIATSRRRLRERTTACFWNCQTRKFGARIPLRDSYPAKKKPAITLP